MKRCAFLFLLFAACTGWAQNTTYKILDVSFLQLIDTTEKVQKLAGGFGFLEGPLWAKEGYLLFSDLPANKIYKLTNDGKTEVFIDKSGFTGTDTAGLAQHLGSDALAYDRNGNILVCQHGNHAIAMLMKNKTLKTVVDSYEGKRLNSPDDLAVKRDGSIYFTDPPYGLAKGDNDPHKAQKQNGVYRYKNGQLTLLSTDYRYPNGITFSPDEKYLYVGSYGKDEPVRRYEVATGGTLKNAKVFSTLNGDGLRVDAKGNLYLCNAQGIHVFSPAGNEIGLIICPQPVTNVNWGDGDYKTLYIVGRTEVYKVRTKVGGIKP